MKISVKKEMDLIRISIADTGLGFIEHNNNGISLSNIRERLEALYGSQGLLLAEPQGELFRVKLSYPREEVV